MRYCNNALSVVRPSVVVNFFYCSATAQQNSTKLDMKQDHSVICQVVVFRTDLKIKMAALASDSHTFSISLRQPLKHYPAISEEKSEISQPIRGHGDHLLFPIGPKNTNLVEEVNILLPVKFPWIPFSGFKKVKNMKVYAGWTDWRMTGRRAMTKAHLSLRLRWA